MTPKYDEYGNIIGWEEDPGIIASPSGPDAPTASPAGQPQTPTDNPGAPGSPTEAINSQWKNPGDKWVEQGNTGGYLGGKGVTVGEGSSMTGAEQAQYIQDALGSGMSQEWIDDFLSKNKWDESRLRSAYKSELGDKGDGSSTMQRVSGGGGGQDDWLRSMLKQLGMDGRMNQDILNRRVSNAADVLNANRKSQLRTNEAALASRGLIGDGPQKTANENLESRLGQSFNDAVNEIYANEGENADARMMQALSLASGLDIADANRLVDWFRAQTERDSSEGQLGLGWGRLGLDSMLGQGQLALGNMNGVNNFNLGLAQLGLDRDKFLAGLDQQDYDRLQELINQLTRAGAISAGGYPY